MTGEADARRAVCAAGRRLLKEGLVARTWGNVSCRTDEDKFIITASGLSYEGMAEEDTVLFDMASGTWAGSRKPSSEKGVHAAAYRRFPDAGAAIHTHQCAASALGLAGFGTIALTASESAALGGLALVEYGLPGTKKLTGNVEAAMAGGAHTVLMAHHGALIVGRDMDEAFDRALLLETVCARALRGQSDAQTKDEARLSDLTDKMRRVFPCASCTHAAAAVAASNAGPIRAELDDMAQMIGRVLTVAEPEEAAVLTALKKHDATLVRGLGAIARADTEGDAKALCLLTEKACVCALHTGACGERATLSPFDTALMRYIYLKKYSKKIKG